MIKAILFDMDGVLYDSMPNHARAWYETMSALNTVCTPRDFYLYEGRTGDSTINIIFNRSFNRDATAEEIEKIYAQKAKRFNELEVKPKPMSGALDVLTKVKEMGLLRVIVTGSGQKSLFNKLDDNFAGFFDKNLMVTAYDVKYGKPNPEPYLIGLERANIQANEAIVVENAPLGVEAGHSAGIYTIAVNTGPLEDNILLNAGADILFPSMNVLADNIENIVKQRS
ncbi:HAD superfamily hydrolase (TIGR01509 family) [Dysgonomonadaceae bacterium PH5-43]|nr:HAD superfamily hydrolase (TIGR01509 family) [Dysgonomonadaceae bacterium PH5-43]